MQGQDVFNIFGALFGGMGIGSFFTHAFHLRSDQLKGLPLSEAQRQQVTGTVNAVAPILVRTAEGKLAQLVAASLPEPAPTAITASPGGVATATVIPAPGQPTQPTRAVLEAQILELTALHSSLPPDDAAPSDSPPAFRAPGS